MISDYTAATFFPSSPSFLSHPLAIRQPKLKCVVYVDFDFDFFFIINYFLISSWFSFLPYP